GGGNGVEQKRALAAHLCDIARGREAVVGAVGDGRVVVAGLRGAAVAAQVDAPGVVTAAGEEIHSRGIGAPRHLQVEGRLRSHGRAVHEQDSAGRARGIAGVLVPQKQADIAALVGPVLLAADDGGWGNGLVYGGGSSFSAYHPGFSVTSSAGPSRRAQAASRSRRGREG